MLFTIKLSPIGVWGHREIYNFLFLKHTDSTYQIKIGKVVLERKILTNNARLRTLELIAIEQLSDSDYLNS